MLLPNCRQLCIRAVRGDYLAWEPCADCVYVSLIWLFIYRPKQTFVFATAFIFDFGKKVQQVEDTVDQVETTSSIFNMRRLFLCCEGPHIIKPLKMLDLKLTSCVFHW